MDRRMKKAQIAIEFFIMAGVAIMISLGFLIYVAVMSSEEADVQRDGLVRDIVHHVRNEINLAFIVENGYYHEFTLPQTMGRYEYEIYIDDDELYASIDDVEYSVIIPNITGNVVKGTNVIRKENNIVMLN